ncbi:MAG: RNA polymerase sigma factor [Acholeplasmataceae bacterium]|nr:RNA polymerase sigma factor [Acholeplasmataceae bacterium]
MDHRELDNFIERYLNGDTSAFDIIYEETKKSVYLSIYSLIKDRSSIEDLMQDTYMKAINSLDYYQIGTNFRAWISRIARNTTINYLKKKNREDVVDPQETTIISELEDKGNLLLDQALRILSEPEKEIIVYRIVLNYTFKEISSILNIPLGTVFWNYQRAIKKIKREL